MEANSMIDTVVSTNINVASGEASLAVESILGMLLFLMAVYATLLNV